MLKQHFIKKVKIITDLEKYIDLMTNKYNQFSWEIGWESLPKYIGHKIYNLNTKQVAIVNWDTGFPQLLDLRGKEIVCFCADFRSGNAFWIYKVGENYNDSNKQSMGAD